MADKVESAKKEQGGQENSEEQAKTEMPKWQKRLYLGLGLTMGGLIVGNAVLFSLPDRDERGNDVEDEFSSLGFPVQYYRRLKNKIFTTKKAIEEPFSDKLLPDPPNAQQLI